MGYDTSGVWMDGDDLIERKSQDVEPILEHAKALRGVNAVGSSELKYAASLPHAVVEQYRIQHGLTQHEVFANPIHFRNMLNDPDLSGFRIWPGRV